MEKKTSWVWLIGALAAIVSAVILVVVFWDRLLELCPCCKNDWDDDFMEDDGPVFTEDELEDFADLDVE